MRWAAMASASGSALSPAPSHRATSSSRRSSTSNWSWCDILNSMFGLSLLVLTLAVPQQDLLADGQRAFERGDLPRAESLFREHLKRFPRSAEALSNLAAIDARRGEFAAAVPLYEQALQLDSKLVPIHFNLAVSLGQLKEYARAASE